MRHNIKPGDFFIAIAKSPASTYGNGEYVAGTVTPHAVIGYRTSVGDHNCGDEKTLTALDYELFDPVTDLERLDQHVKQLEHFGKAPERGEKLGWVGHVYAKALAASTRLAYIHQQRLQEERHNALHDECECYDGGDDRDQPSEPPMPLELDARPGTTITINVR